MDAAGGAALGPPAAGETAVVQGSPGSSDFDAFARRERRPLVAFAWSLTGDRGVAEDLAQEALEAAWQRWADVGGYERPGAWARRVVANRAAGRGRRVGRERRAYGRWLGGRAEAVEPDMPDGRFWAEVRKLPERQAHAVALFYLEDLPVADIAAVLGCAEGTVKAHLHRGRLRLAHALGLVDATDGAER
jgi:RNA polymerase sigma-70 factor (ECF subfamily)